MFNKKVFWRNSSGFTAFDNIPDYTDRNYGIEKDFLQTYHSEGSKRSLSPTPTNDLVLSTQQFGQVRTRRLTERMVRNIKKLKIIEFVGGAVMIIAGGGCIILNKILPALSGDSTLQIVGSSLISAGAVLITIPLQLTAIDALKKPIKSTKPAAIMRTRGFELGAGNEAVASVQPQENKVKKHKLTKRAAENVRIMKIIEFVGGLTLVGGGVACIILHKVIPSTSGDATLQTIGSSLVSAGVTMLLMPAKSKTIDSLKEPVTAEGDET